MSKEIENKILSNIPLTENEAYEFLKYFCTHIREDVGIIDTMDPNCKVCDETTQKFGVIMLMYFGCDVEILDIKKILNIPLTHYSNIIYIDVNGEEKIYLVDMTYSQFFGERITLDDNKKINISNIRKNMEQQDFVIKLRKDGFVELTNDILKNYFDYFLTICKAQNKSLAYENINKIFEREKDYNKNKIR